MIFLILSIIIFNLIAFKMEKRLTKSEVYQTCLFSGVFQLLTDFVLELNLNLYGYFQSGADFRSLIVILGVYPAVNIIFLNYYPFEKGIKQKSIYILIWSLFITIYEWGSIKAGFFYHNEWELWYSFILYPFILGILVWNLSYFRSLKREEKLHYS